MTAGSGPDLPALPPFFEFTTPVSWRAVDFLSDVHLAPDMPRTFAAWASHVRNTAADAVFILGDLFELWVGDDARSRPFERQCADVLAEVASKRQLAVMVGNRDFLLGSAMLREIGAMGLPDPTVLSAWGQRILLSHGDALCLSDHRYLAFRAQVRTEAWQAGFLAMPLPDRIRMATAAREVSENGRRNQMAPDLDIDAAQAVRWMHAMGVQEMIHGHTHRPGSSTLAPGFRRHVLSDWDLDSAGRADVLRLTRDGLERIPAGGT